MSRGKKDREEIKNKEKSSAEADKMEQVEESKDADDKSGNLYEQDPFIDPSVYRYRRKKRMIRTVTITAVAVLLAVYIGGVIFHMHCFGLNTTINGKDVAGKTVKSVENMLLADARNYILDIKFRDSDFTFALGIVTGKS